MYFLETVIFSDNVTPTVSHFHISKMVSCGNHLKTQKIKTIDPGRDLNSDRPRARRTSQTICQSFVVYNGVATSFGYSSTTAEEGKGCWLTRPL